MSETDTTQVVVGRVGRAHGLRGEVFVQPRTDEPQRRFAPGAALLLRTPGGDPPHGGSRPGVVTVRGCRWQGSRLVVRFEQVADRAHAEALGGLVLLVEPAAADRPEDEDEYFDHQLVGLHVVTTDAAAVGEVVSVRHGSAQDLLCVRADGAAEEVLVPFVRELVPVVDTAMGRLVVADRPGLLNPDGMWTER